VAWLGCPVSVDIKFCGLTRAADAEFAAELGAAYVGVIFAGGPRTLTLDRAMEVLAGVPRLVNRVGVFAEQSAHEIARAADWLQLDVVQLHGSATPSRIAEIRRDFSGDVWPVCRVAGSALPAGAADAMSVGDGLLLDAYAPGALGGTGVSLEWSEIADEVAALRAPGKPLVLAGGLRPTNVAAAIAALAPDVVDVSSGVESGAGVKDHARMRAFRDAVKASIKL
jgi:phosphoribosylanthranilate isomerase